MKLLFVGDIVGNPGRKKIAEHITKIIEKEKIGFTVAQGENLAGGIGITEETAKDLFKVGIDCITTGNHVWKHKEIYKYLNEEPRLLRPANYPEGTPGHGYLVYEKDMTKIGVINLEGRVFMKPLESPFVMGKKIAETMRDKTNNIFVDFHAEATSEKKALGYYLSQYATAVIGTHTHVQTVDEQIIDNKTAYITDVGMVGSVDSVIGVKKEEVIDHFLFTIPQKFKVAKDKIIANCVIVDFDENTGQARSITRYNF